MIKKYNNIHDSSSATTAENNVNFLWLADIINLIDML